ncbi:MAG: TOTE conflict system archaeo-eukaryotic primase domain-containing protein, partial [Candidatus Angelobacter sp.]
LQDGVEAALEKSRRGGHLWIFAAQPLLARDCRLYIYNLAQRLKVPIKGASLADGIEVFPKQDMVPANEFGNAIRGPLGIHRGTGRRYWFYGADYTLNEQIQYLSRIKRITANDMAGFVADLKMPEEFEPPPRITLPPPDPRRPEFRILDHVMAKRRQGRNYWSRCPSCAQQGHDRSGDNLAIAICDPRKYKCWAGCTKEMIRAALGCPIGKRTAR